jgi:hypothetical protein
VRLASIEDIQFDGAGSAICTKHAVLLFAGNSSADRICLETGRFFPWRLTVENLQSGDRVSITLTQTVFGSAIKVITRVRKVRWYAEGSLTWDIGLTRSPGLKVT